MVLDWLGLEWSGSFFLSVVGIGLGRSKIGAPGHCRCVLLDPFAYQRGSAQLGVNFEVPEMVDMGSMSNFQVPKMALWRTWGKSF